MPLGFARGAHNPQNQVTVAQVIATELRLRNVNIIVANGVVLAQETDPLRHDLQHAAAHFDAFLFRFKLDDADDQILLFHAFGVRNVQRHGLIAEGGKRKIF